MEFLGKLWDGVKDSMGDDGYGKWILGGLAAVVGLATGGVSILGFLLAAALAALAITFIAPALYARSEGSDVTQTPPISPPAGEKARTHSLSTEQRLVAKVTEYPTDEDRNKMKAVIDGQEYDIKIKYGDKFKTESITYQKAGDPMSARTFDVAMTLGALDAEGTNFVPNKGAVDQMIGKLAKDMRSKLLENTRDMGSDLNLIQGRDGQHAYTMRGESGARYVIKAEGDKLEVYNLKNEHLKSVTLSESDQLQYASTLSRTALKAVAAVESDPMARKTVVADAAVGFASGGPAITVDSTIIAKDGKPATEGSFMANDQKIEYKLESQNEAKGHISKKLTLIVNGKEIAPYSAKQINLGLPKNDATGKTTYRPDEDKFKELFTHALKQYDESIEGLKTHLKPPARVGAGGEEVYFLEAQKSNYALMAKKDAAGKFRVTVTNLADGDSKVVDGAFRSKDDALKAGLHTVVDEFGEDGKRGVQVKKPNMLREYAVTVPTGATVSPSTLPPAVAHKDNTRGKPGALQA